MVGQFGNDAVDHSNVAVERTTQGTAVDLLVRAFSGSDPAMPHDKSPEGLR